MMVGDVEGALSVHVAGTPPERVHVRVMGGDPRGRAGQHGKKVCTMEVGDRVVGMCRRSLAGLQGRCWSDRCKDGGRLEEEMAGTMEGAPRREHRGRGEDVSQRGRKVVHVPGEQWVERWVSAGRRECCIRGICVPGA
jgi:hypothetical protein